MYNVTIGNLIIYQRAIGDDVEYTFWTPAYEVKPSGLNVMSYNLVGLKGGMILTR